MSSVVWFLVVLYLLTGLIAVARVSSFKGMPRGAFALIFVFLFWPGALAFDLWEEED